MKKRVILDKGNTFLVTGILVPGNLSLANVSKSFIITSTTEYILTAKW